MMQDPEQTVYCFECHKWMHPFGMPMHRKAHLVRGEHPVFRMTNGNTLRFVPCHADIDEGMRREIFAGREEA